MEETHSRDIQTHWSGDKAVVWRSAEDALVAGDDVTLARLLREYDQMFRTEQPRSSWFGGLTPDYKSGDARAIVARNHFFESWEQFAGFASKLNDPSSAVARFERAVDALVSGNAASLERMLREYREPYYEVVALLVGAGAPVEPAWLSEENATVDPRLFAALTGKSDRS